MTSSFARDCAFGDLWKGGLQGRELTWYREAEARFVHILGLGLDHHLGKAWYFVRFDRCVGLRLAKIWFYVRDRKSVV